MQFAPWIRGFRPGIVLLQWTESQRQGEMLRSLEFKLCMRICHILLYIKYLKSSVRFESGVLIEMEYSVSVERDGRVIGALKGNRGTIWGLNRSVCIILKCMYMTKSYALIRNTVEKKIYRYTRARFWFFHDKDGIWLYRVDSMIGWNGLWRTAVGDGSDLGRLAGEYAYCPVQRQATWRCNSMRIVYGLLATVLHKWYGVISNLSAKGGTAFIWKLRRHWLKGLR